MQETRPMTQTAPRSGMAMAAVLATLLTACGSSGDAGPQPIEILSLSNRADMISDGNAYLEILLPKGIPAGALKVELNGADVTAQSPRAPMAASWAGSTDCGWAPIPSPPRPQGVRGHAWTSPTTAEATPSSPARRPNPGSAPRAMAHRPLFPCRARRCRRP